MRTIEAFTEPADRTNIFTPVMLVHQKNNEGNSIIHDYLLQGLSGAQGFSQLPLREPGAAGRGHQDWRGAFPPQPPETMGSIYWQLNDCWPVASWSSIDYYGRWKALQYYARRFYAPILVSPHVENGIGEGLHRLRQDCGRSPPHFASA